ncbi:pimeloyl-ACP methyl ester carboxylesterase [Paraburkholderia sp. WSM4177]|nr:pimeloyl-ACP methyl ester carboxylesterase [Paraburkholderia sp. WSM4177]
MIWFSQGTLEQVLTSHEVVLSVYDPYREGSVERHGQTVPLSANFSAGYGIWLARSGFAGQSLRTLFGSAHGIDTPRIYMTQPFDPNRRIILMLHGLASSPEAWVNVANDIQGDEVLRQHFQVWQVYYPTNVPILVNLARFRRATQQTLVHFDPDGTAPASHGMVLIGHSMGGVLARLLVSTSGDALWATFEDKYVPEGTDIDREDERLNRLLNFTPMPQVERAIFIAAPHRGTPFASNRLSRWAANLVRLPLALLNEIEEVMQTATNIEPQGRTFHVPNSIEHLRETDPLIRATSQLPISAEVCFHSIIARRRENGPLEDSDDGVVPYRSAHLVGALSEKVIVAGHGVQETPRAILEIRRIFCVRILRRSISAGRFAGRLGIRSDRGGASCLLRRLGLDEVAVAGLCSNHWYSAPNQASVTEAGVEDRSKFFRYKLRIECYGLAGRVCSLWRVVAVWRERWGIVHQFV